MLKKDLIYRPSILIAFVMFCKYANAKVICASGEANCNKKCKITAADDVECTACDTAEWGYIHDNGGEMCCKEPAATVAYAKTAHAQAIGTCSKKYCKKDKLANWQICKYEWKSGKVAVTSVKEDDADCSKLIKAHKKGEGKICCLNASPTSSYESDTAYPTACALTPPPPNAASTKNSKSHLLPSVFCSSMSFIVFATLSDIKF